MKMVFLKLTGAKNRKGLNIGMGQWVASLKEYRNFDHKKASEAFMAKHSAIMHLVFMRHSKHLSLTLQNIDSSISQHVISELQQLGIVALDIHDSFIVKRQDEEKLREIMKEAFIVKGIISIPEITGVLGP